MIKSYVIIRQQAAYAQWDNAKRCAGNNINLDLQQHSCYTKV